MRISDCAKRRKVVNLLVAWNHTPQDIVSARANPEGPFQDMEGRGQRIVDAYFENIGTLRRVIAVQSLQSV